MKLWIRSQDKNRLTKVDDLYIVHDDNNFCDYIGNNIVGHLAKYTKQGRALEVLDEIQNILNLKDMYKYDRELVLKGWENVDKEQVKIVRKQMSVYEMPKE